MENNHPFLSPKNIDMCLQVVAESSNGQIHLLQDTFIRSCIHHIFTNKNTYHNQLINMNKAFIQNLHTELKYLQQHKVNPNYRKEDIAQTRQNEFNSVLAQKQSEFNSLHSRPIPPMIDFTDKGFVVEQDKPIENLNFIIEQKMKERNPDYNLANNGGITKIKFLDNETLPADDILSVSSISWGPNETKTYNPDHPPSLKKIDANFISSSSTTASNPTLILLQSQIREMKRNLENIESTIEQLITITK